MRAVNISTVPLLTVLVLGCQGDSEVADFPVDPTISLRTDLIDLGNGCTVSDGVTVNGTQIVGTEYEDYIDCTQNTEGVRVRGLGDSDRIWGGSGDDVLDGGAGCDAIDGGEGNDRLVGGSGSESFAAIECGYDVYGYIHGGPGNDVLVGGPGDDAMYGDEGDDRLIGGPDNDKLFGGPGADSCIDGPGLDLVRECERGTPGEQ